MKILVINSGSSSLKYTLFEMAHEKVLFSGTVDRIGLSGTTHEFRVGLNGEDETRLVDVTDHGEALDEILSTLTNGPLDSLDELPAVAHRVGHGGKYKEAVPVNSDVVREIRRMTPMIPLHHPAMIKEIEECQIRMPDALHVAVFDTSFHRTIPDYAAIYGLPYRYFAERGYRKTGFHGHSHQYVSGKVSEFMQQNIRDLKIISCHLGNGASVTAIDGGRSVDTTLGMTAVEGLIMGTRSGDVDPGLMPIIMKEDSLSPDQTIDMLYRESGLLGISGLSRDMREVEAAALKGNDRATLALSAFCHKARRSIGSMLMVLGGCDALIFTGGIGNNSSTVRFKILEGTAKLGFVMDDAKNNGQERTTPESPVLDISHPESGIRIFVVRTFEELMMARECLNVLKIVREQKQ
ncbi:MAG: acetate kinase [Desulfomonile tiedjei]|uniref:Acetate kinase n=1 Tax=Desulfomonile tiedjei TaxID=2358 RepID=A0A9D6V9Y5_9BACT|nr:acetate kinase [Desulfomonile tiedjei]